MSLPKIPDHIDRAITERQELMKKIAKLGTFVNNQRQRLPNERIANERQLHLLSVQYKHMSAYAEVLAQRIGEELAELL